MKHTTKRLLAVLMALGITCSLAACGRQNTATAQSNQSVPAEQSASSSEQTGIANPVETCTYDELVQKSGISLPAPKGAKDVSYSLINMEDGKSIAQMNFTLDGHTAYLRAQSTSQTKQAEDISGLNYKWANKTKATVSYNDAVVYLKDGIGYIAWLDVVPGIQYNLCMETGADEATLTDLANQVFVPTQGEADSNS